MGRNLPHWDVEKPCWDRTATSLLAVGLALTAGCQSTAFTGTQPAWKTILGSVASSCGAQGMWGYPLCSLGANSMAVRTKKQCVPNKLCHPLSMWPHAPQCRKCSPPLPSPGGHRGNGALHEPFVTLGHNWARPYLHQLHGAEDESAEWGVRAELQVAGQDREQTSWSHSLQGCPHSAALLGWSIVGVPCKWYQAAPGFL